ncbi:hypothetical protein BGZ94_007818 [Podila epigama]|nr:hypothetical protein BGZ94_007818 [Podila epigama]
MSFRAHQLKAQELKHTSSFSSMSSYDSYQNEDSLSDSYSSSAEDDPTHRRHKQQRNVQQKPGGGSPLRPAGRAHDWYSGGRITSHGRWFKDANNRTLLLRGVNLCGNTKLPTTPNGSTHLNEGFFNHREVSFVGRPFPRDQADEHFSRLKSWGLTFVRLLVPWEALEHSGPGIYDEQFIDSIIELIELMPKYGIKCFIDPHQDCWSRFSGGSGAPGWTFEAAGLDLTKFKTTGAAYVHNTNQSAGDSPPMVWPTNYTKLAASTMFTLFWAGDTFAPNKMYRGEPIQQFLQNRYFECYQHLARRLKNLDAVVGFEVMNEPHPGFVGLKDLKKYDFNSNLFFGDNPSAVEAMALGAGMALPIDVWVRSWPFPTKKQGTRIVNAEKDVAWLDGECVWKQHGVWSVHPKTGQPQVEKPDYFSVDPITGEKVDFHKYYLDFIGKYSRAIQSVLPSAFVFVEPVPNEPAPVWGPEHHEENIVYAPHWYDLHALFNKSFDGRITHDVQGLSKGKSVFAATYFGLNGARKNYKGQLSNILNTGLQNVGNKPCLIGECGIPMDINQRQAFMNGDYGYHSKFLDAVLSSLEANLLSFTLWNYNATNDNTHGDHWNGEDFSIFSLDSPRPSPSLSRTGSPGPESQRTLRQQAPNFAKEVMKRAATSTNDNSSSPKQSLYDEKQQTPRMDKKEEFEDIDFNASTWNEEDTVAGDSPFDRSYFAFEDEYSYDGRDHEAHIGGRALDAVVRPYAAKVAGEPISTEFNLATLQYTFRFCNYIQPAVPVVQVSTPDEEEVEGVEDHSRESGTTLASLQGNEGRLEGVIDSLKVGGATSPGTSWFGHPPEGSVQAFETEIFIPSYHYDDVGLSIEVSDGDWRYVRERQTLYYRHRDIRPGAVHSVLIRPLTGAGAVVTKVTSSSSSSSSPMSPCEKEGSSYTRNVMQVRQKTEGSEYDTYGSGGSKVRAESDAAGCVQCMVM